MTSRAKDPKSSTEFGSRLREGRHDLGLTVRAAGERVGCSPAQLSRYETGTAFPRFEKIEQIATGLNIDAGELVRRWVLDRAAHSHPHSSLYTHLANAGHESARAEQIRDSTFRFLMDMDLTPDTASVLRDMAEALDLLRRKMSPLRHTGVDVRCLQPQDTTYSALAGCARVRHCPVNASRKGLGFMATKMRFPPQVCGYHKEDSSLLEPGSVLFYVVLRGSGHLFCRRPARGRGRREAQWQHFALEFQTVGLHPTGFEQAIVNGHRSEPLDMFVVCMPFRPPKQAELNGLERVVGRSFELSFRELQSLPPKLRALIVQVCSPSG